MGGVFLSYRRDDSSGHAGRLYDHLVAKLGRDRVFRDVDTIAPGENFVEVLRERVKNASAVLILIGRRWLDATNENGTRRLDDPRDFVRLEVEMALEHKTLVIPVLVDGARMPKAEQLPPSLQGLRYANAVQLDEDTFDYEVDRLARRLEPMLGGPRWSRRWIQAAGAALIVGSALEWWRFQSGVSAPPPQVNAAREMAKAGDFKGAWDLLAAQPASAAGVLDAREDVAMNWVRTMGARDTQRDPVLPAVVDLAAPVLMQGAERSAGARKADLLAHYGWCLYLRRRMGEDVDAAAPYEQALKADARNPFANVMMGHWILLRKHEDGIAEARRYFQAALDSGRERAELRRIQLAGIENTWADPTDAEYLRVCVDMLKNKEPLTAQAIYKAQSVYYFAVGGIARRNSVTAALSPADHILLLRKLREEIDESRRTTVDIWLGRVQELAGNRGEALEAYKRVKVTPDMIDSWRQEVTSAIRRLSE